VGGGRELAAKCRGMTPDCLHRAARYLHSDRDGCTVTGFSRTVTGSDAQSPRWCQWRGVGGDLPFDFGVRSGSGHLMLLSGGMGEAPSVNARPRARRRFARGALGPSSEARLARGAQILERGRDLLEGSGVPRARRRWDARASALDGWARATVGP
jgi:hypothetical protein